MSIESPHTNLRAKRKSNIKMPLENLPGQMSRPSKLHSFPIHIPSQAMDPQKFNSSSHRRRSTSIRHRDVDHTRILRNDRDARNSSRVARRGCHTLLRLCLGRSTFSHHDRQVTVVSGGRRIDCSLCSIALRICSGGGCRGWI